MALLLAAALLAAALLGKAAVAAAATAVVTSCANDQDLVAQLATLDAAGGGTLTFACGPDPVAIVLAQRIAIGTNPVTIDGANRIVLSGGNTVPLFLVPDGRNLTLRRLTLTRSVAAAGSGAVTVGGGAHFKAIAVVFDQNHTAGSGGAVLGTAGATVKLKRCYLSGNTADGDGGAIELDTGGTLTVIRSTLGAGSAGRFGGAIHAKSSSVVARVTEFSENHAAWDGGAIYGDRSSVTVAASNFSTNDATQFEGGAIANVFGHVVARDSGFVTNTAGLRGGAISSKGVLFPDQLGILEVERSTFFQNGVPGSGVAGAVGGAIYNHAYGYFTDLDVNDNRAPDGTGLYAEEYPIEVTRCLFRNNAGGASGKGGGIRSAGANLTVTNSTFSGNTAENGGGIFLSTADGSITNCTFSGNFAAAQGANLDVDNLVAGRFGVLNSILDAGAAGSGSCAGNFTSLGHNVLRGDATCPTVASDLASDPKLGALADNGGRTQTLAPQLSSSALDAGTSAGCPADDQRGFPRPQGLACDIGAVERCAAKPAATVLTAPDDAAVLPLGDVWLEWDGPPCAEHLSVEVRNGSKTGSVYAKTPVFFGRLLLTPPAGTYAWRARACNAVGCRNSAWRTFSVQ